MVIGMAEHESTGPILAIPPEQVYVGLLPNSIRHTECNEGYCLGSQIDTTNASTFGGDASCCDFSIFRGFYLYLPAP